MAYNFRYPMITGASEREQLAQIKTYLYQFVDQLQWALNNIDTVQTNYTVKVSDQSNKKDETIGTRATFNSLKPLIIKSADIVNAYYVEISKRLEGLYVAQSAFGTYAEETAHNISENSTSITRAFTNIQVVSSNVETISDEVGALDSDIQGVKQGVDSNIQIITNEVGALDSKIESAKEDISADIQSIKNDMDDLNQAVVEVNANIRSGLLYYDDNEVPIYGLEIGQKNFVDGVEVFDKYARFTSDRLSFYDHNDSEVAYISDYKLYITNAEITGTLKLGAFRIDTSSGFKLKYVGRR